LSKLKALKKMGLATLAEAKAMDSFDSTLPQVFLGKGVAPLVVMKNETDFPGVKTYAYWSNEGAGLRSKIGDELKTIPEGITNQIIETRNDWLQFGAARVDIVDKLGRKLDEFHG
jgi:hypothetical protein